LEERTEENVAMASTSVPPAVASEAMVGQSNTHGRLGVRRDSRAEENTVEEDELADPQQAEGTHVRRQQSAGPKGAAQPTGRA
jgi:hypothetical protein